jgi:hypothetical protein
VDRGEREGELNMGDPAESIESAPPRDSTIVYARNLELALFQAHGKDDRAMLLAHALDNFFRSGARSMEFDASMADAKLQRERQESRNLQDKVFLMDRILDRYRRVFESEGLTKPKETP